MKNKQAELINQLSDKELLYNLLLTQIILLTISFFLGIILFRDYSAFFDLFHLSDIRIITIGLPIGILVVLYDLFMMKVTPARFHDDGGINERIFSSLSSPMIIVVTFLIAFCEEVLFRGVLQTHIGLVWTSIIFAVVHYRYLFNWYLFVNVMMLSFGLGWLYEETRNLWIVIMAHFVIDMLLGLIIRKKNRKGCLT
ncbi:CPBP family intramembrane glutamic endopeptidase [Peribacillus asahii]|uniref:CPBP family intramembrane glutamic endopeptidase n=1 Tax=Peribacillus asahii TaxID=228899 RepID=UPI0020792B66|nr:CPBP family intramembrane glutamic endopeptidase [Peribacillus asahii]USK69019.1 CPBP family intramembrane metalloprotease [Peribacillus asahii]